MESCFSYGLNLAPKVYLLTERFSRTLQRDKSAIEGKEAAGKKIFENKKNEESADQ